MNLPELSCQGLRFLISELLGTDIGLRLRRKQNREAKAVWKWPIFNLMDAFQHGQNFPRRGRFVSEKCHSWWSLDSGQTGNTWEYYDSLEGAQPHSCIRSWFKDVEKIWEFQELKVVSTCFKHQIVIYCDQECTFFWWTLQLPLLLQLSCFAPRPKVLSSPGAHRVILFGGIMDDYGPWYMEMLYGILCHMLSFIIMSWDFWAVLAAMPGF